MMLHKKGYSCLVCLFVLTVVHVLGTLCVDFFFFITPDNIYSSSLAPTVGSSLAYHVHSNLPERICKLDCF